MAYFLWLPCAGCRVQKLCIKSKRELTEERIMLNEQRQTKRDYSSGGKRLSKGLSRRVRPRHNRRGIRCLACMV